jgi:hypothetical protein
MSAAKHTPKQLARLAERAGARIAAETARFQEAASAKWKAEEERRLRLSAAAPDLLAACEAAAAWMHDPADATGHFERLADEFHRDTGFTRPGKDAAAAAHQDAMACDIAWNEWRVAKAARVLATVRAAIAKARGK